MPTCTLNWYPDRGFELDLDAADDDISLRMVSIPVPADGTAELRAGVELDRLEILFKAQVDVQGEPGQLHDARIQLIEADGTEQLKLSARVEDVETGEIVNFHVKVPVRVPPGAPERGGPRPLPANEDELDWEDETTLEQMIVAAPESTSRSEAREEEEKEEAPPSGGLKALLDALARLGDEGDDEGEDLRDESPAPAAPPGPGDDQRISEEQEAAGLLQLLIDRDGLELEDAFEVDHLVPGVVQILARPMSSEAKATALSEWLLSQDAVADLFIGDGDLAEILEQW